MRLALRIAGVLVLCTCVLWGDDEERLRILVSALQSPDSSIREQACMSLAALGAGALDGLPVLLSAAANDSDPNVREEATRTVGKLLSASQSATLAVLAALKDPSRAVRSAAITALSEPDAPPEEAVGPVSDAFLKDPDPVFRDKVFTWYAKFSSLPAEAIPSILDALKSGDASLQNKAARRALSYYRLGDELKQVFRTIAEEGLKSDTRQNADLTILALKAIITTAEPNEKYVAFLVHKASDPDNAVRSGALETLALLQESEAAQEQLRKAARSESDFRIRKFAVSSLNPTKDPEAGQVLQSSLSDKVGVVRAAALDVIAGAEDLRAFLCPAILKMTGDPITSVRTKTFTMLANCPRSMVTATLVAGVADPSPSIRAASIVSLRSIYQSPSNSSDLLDAMLGGRKQGLKTPGRWQASLEPPDQVVAAILRALSDQETAVSKEAAATLIELAPLNKTYLPQIASLALQRSPSGLMLSRESRLAALRVLGSFGSDAQPYIQGLNEFLTELLREQARQNEAEEYDEARRVIDEVIDALALIAPATEQSAQTVQGFINANWNVHDGSVSALNGIAKFATSIDDPLPLVRKLSLAEYSSTLTDAARNRALARIPNVSALIKNVIKEVQQELKTAKPLEEVGIFEDHPTYKLRRLSSLLQTLDVKRSATIKLLALDGRPQTIVADDQNYVIAMGTWCVHSKLLVQLLTSPSFKRLMGGIHLNFVFDNEWPLAESQLHDEVAGGNMIADEARERLTSLKRAAAGAQVIFPDFLQNLPGKVWLIPRSPKGEPLRPIPGVFDPGHGDFRRGQDDMVSKEMLIPEWITSKISW